MLGRRDGEIVWADVLDYKTDRVDEAALDERTAYYRPQLESYGRVVAAQTGLAADKRSACAWPSSSRAG